MRSTVPLFHRWKFQTVEWNSKVAAAIQPQWSLNTTTTAGAGAGAGAAPSSADAPITHYVLPDLPPPMCTLRDRADYFRTTVPHQRIITVATCHYATPQSLVQHLQEEIGICDFDKLLLVGGNEKTSNNGLSVVEAAKIILLERPNDDITLWGVTNPNDPESPSRVQDKIDAGISGFLTQPLLASYALDVFESYPRFIDNENTHNHNNTIQYIAGVALPTSAKNLNFWCDLTEDNPSHPLHVRQDPLFRAHLAYYAAQPHYVSLQWIAREVMNLATRSTMDGIHFMPMGNTKDLITILQQLN